MTVLKTIAIARSNMSRAAVFSLALLLSIAVPASALPSASVEANESCEFFSVSQRYNTQADGDVVVIGALRNRRYRVVVASQRPDVFAAIRACVTDAFLTRSSLGDYIQVGSFEGRSDAEAIRRILVRAGYPARTVYVR